MTGEITLRGRVLPIGGLKEKLMAAHRHGILEAIMPRENEKDLPDIPDAIKKTMKLHFVDSMDEVLKIALEREMVALPLPPGMPGRCPQVEVQRAPSETCARSAYETCALVSALDAAIRRCSARGRRAV